MNLVSDLLGQWTTKVLSGVMLYVSRYFILTFLSKRLLVMQSGVNHTLIYPFSNDFMLVVIVHYIACCRFLIHTSALFHNKSIIYGFSIRMYFCRYFLMFLVSVDMEYWNILNSNSSSSSLSSCAYVKNYVFLDLYFLLVISLFWIELLVLPSRHRCLYIFTSLCQIFGTQPDCILYSHTCSIIFLSQSLSSSFFLLLFLFLWSCSQ